MPFPVPDMTANVDLSLHLGTGPVRSRRPIYANLLAPCNQACPAGEDIQAWLALAQAGRFKEAWHRLVADNPLPAVHGRVCYHPCESQCNRASVDSAVGIHAIERFLGDLAGHENWGLPEPKPASGHRVLIVGAGPSGLSAAYHLNRLGHHVEIYEAGPLPGGMLHFGIPAYRLPRDVLLAEIRRIEAAGVRLHLNRKVEDVVADRQAGDFDAVFVAIGAHLAKRVDIPSRDAKLVWDAVALLRKVDSGETPTLGRRVVIYGGGNTAMDAARTAKRLGVEAPLIIYHRDRAHMPAHDFEASEALAEGVRIRWLTSIRAIDADSLTVEVMQLDAAGRPQPTGQFENIAADALVLALGQEADSRFLEKVAGVERRADGTVVVGPDMMTGHPGLFAGGDMVPSERTVTVAVGHGKAAARHIDAYLRQKAPVVVSAPLRVATRELLRLPIYEDADKAQQSERLAEVRVHDFEEITGGLSQQAAAHEAKRCFSCGNCFFCDMCLAACPHDAIDKSTMARGYQIALDRCTGCAVCVEQCPCHAMDMIPETTTA